MESYNKEYLNIRDMTSDEMKSFSGGLHPVIWLVIGYVVGEIVEGIDAANQRGCLKIKE